MDVFNRVRQVMLDLFKCRRQICSGTLPQVIVINGLSLSCVSTGVISSHRID